MKIDDFAKSHQRAPRGAPGSRTRVDSHRKSWIREERENDDFPFPWSEKSRIGLFATLSRLEGVIFWGFCLSPVLSSLSGFSQASLCGRATIGHPSRFFVLRLLKLLTQRTRRRFNREAAKSAKFCEERQGIKIPPFSRISFAALCGSALSGYPSRASAVRLKDYNNYHRTFTFESLTLTRIPWMHP